ncbi:MAG: DUF4442 domain-containing protein [Oligoflexia bacterium]|nr:DUF4442 domain-containing protein [Oligoflexia bacterium]
MSLQQILDQVPFVAHVGVQVEDYAPGRVVLSLGTELNCSNHMGSMHAGAIFVLAETAASAACATHPDLVGLRLRARAAEIRYRRPAQARITAHAEITDEMADAVTAGLATRGRVDLSVPVEIFDGYGNSVARVLGAYTFRPPA